MAAGSRPSTGPTRSALLEQQGGSRVPELVPIRYGRMLVSPFTFYRGAALIMAADLAATPRSGLHAQLCGDAHLSNFGVFASPERQLMFDINDFDETLPGPWEWDVKRLAASFEVAGRDRGFTPAERRAVVLAGGRGVPGADEAGRRDAQPGCLVRPRRGRDSCSSSSRPMATAQAAGQGQGERRQGPDPGQHAGVRQAHPARSTANAGSSPTRR